MSKKSEENFIKYFDKNLQKYVIIDRKTGFSRYESMDQFCQQNQSLKRKQLSRHLSETKQINEKTNKTNVFSNTDKTLNNEFKQKLDYNNRYKKLINERPDTQLFCSQNQTKVETNNKLLEGFGLTSDMKIDSSVKLDKSLLSMATLRVIGQMDLKFIVCLAIDRQLLVAFDQHAVHERIRYETLLNQVFDTNKNVRTVPVLPPIDITVNCHQLNSSYDSIQTQIKAYLGFELKRVGATNRSHNNSYSVTQIPDCLSDSLDVDSIQEIIREAVIIIDGKTNDLKNGLSAVRLSPKLLERLQTKACRGAIRFGDSLKLHDCQKLIRGLSECKSPFRCAHGRASVAPLAYLPKPSEVAIN